MRKASGFCCLFLLLTGCASQQMDTPSHGSAHTALSSIPYPVAGNFQTPSPQVSMTYDGTMKLGSAAHERQTVRGNLMNMYQRWAGTPYRLGGEGRSGIDCSALVRRIYSDSFKYVLPRTASEQMAKGQKIAKVSLRPGDLVFFKPSRRRHHVGIYVGEGYFMHASSSQGVMLSRLDNSFWAQHFTQARRPLENAQLNERATAALTPSHSNS